MGNDTIAVTEGGQTLLQAYSGTVGGNTVKAETIVVVKSTDLTPLLDGATFKANNATPGPTDTALEIKIASIGNTLMGATPTLPVSIQGATVGISANQGSAGASPWLVTGNRTEGAAPTGGANQQVLICKDGSGNLQFLPIVPGTLFNNLVPIVIDTLQQQTEGSIPVAQNLLGASDKPDVTANQSGSLKINILDPYTGTKARVDSNGNLLHANGIATPTSTQGLTTTPPTYIPFNPYLAPQIPNTPTRQYNGIYR